MKNLRMLLPVLLSVACNSAVPLDVGDVGKSLGQSVEDYSARWDGYAEAMEFNGDGTDRVRLTLDSQGNGTMRFGEEALYGPATDPVGLYPPTFSGNGLYRSGHEYSVFGTKVEAARLRLSVEYHSLMESWCALQSANPAPNFYCGSAFSASISYEVNDAGECVAVGVPPQTFSVPCTLASQCQYCACDTLGCHVDTELESISRKAELDVALSSSGDVLTGTLLLGDDRVTVHLVRTGPASQ
jgi:hypothetical protein